MEKDELMRKIEDAIIVEEQAVPVYSRHLKVILSWYSLSKEKKARLDKIFAILIDESKKHKAILENVRSRIAKGELNV